MDSPPPPQVKANPDEISLSDEEADVDVPAVPPIEQNVPPSGDGHVTAFLALDKCLPRRRFIEVSRLMLLLQSSCNDIIQFLDIPTTTTSPDVTFTFDFEWLAICKAFHPYLSLTHQQTPPFPSFEDAQSSIHEAKDALKAKLLKDGTHVVKADGQDNVLEISVGKVQQFVHTAPPQKKSDQAKVKWNTPQRESNTYPHRTSAHWDLQHRRTRTLRRSRFASSLELRIRSLIPMPGWELLRVGLSIHCNSPSSDLA